jgi:hypothetical protein
MTTEAIKVYLAGDGLKKGNQILRNMERDRLKEIKTIDLFNPWDQKDINDKSKNPTAEMIFQKDTNAILNSEIIVADVDNNSIGTICEMGQLWGVNFMLMQLHMIYDEADGDPDLFVNGVINLMNKIPLKKIYWQTNDIRDTEIEEKGIRRSHSYNQYLIGMMLDMAGEPKKFEEIAREVKEITKADE